MKIPAFIAALVLTSTLHAAVWSIELCSSLDLLAGRTGIADVRPSNDPHDNPLVIEENSGIYRGQWSWQSEMPALLYEILETGKADATSPSGFTALQAACVYADEALFNALLEGGAAVDPRPIDWQQLGYVGDTPLGLLVRFMNARTAAARVRMARTLLERGADPDACMTTWKGNRVVSVTPFCELGKEPYNHEMRMLLLQYGEQNLKKRMNDWSLNWDCFRPELVQHLRQAGVVKTGEIATISSSEVKRELGTIPLLDLIRKGDVEGVRLALEAGAGIEVSPRARRYGHEPLFNIPARKKDSPEAALEIARLLIEAGADVNELNRHGRSLRIHYDRFYSKASKSLCVYFKSCGSLIHPDSPDKKAEVEQTRREARERAAARAARLAAEEPQPVPQPVEETPAPAEDPQPVPLPVEETPAPAEDPQPVPQPVEEAPAPAEDPQPVPQPVEEAPSPAEEPQPVPQPVEETPAPAEDPQPAEPQTDAPAHQNTETKSSAAHTVNTAAQSDPSVRLMMEVQNQLAELQARYEAEIQEKEQKNQQMEPVDSSNSSDL